VEANELLEAAAIVAVVFGSIVKRRSIGPETGRNPNLFRTHGAVGMPDFLCEGHGRAQSFVRCCRTSANLQEPFLRYLIAGGHQAIGSGLQVLAVHRGDQMGGGLQHLRGPERIAEAAADAFQFGGHTAVENLQPVQIEFA
jgi:hypothetical protein